MRNAGRNGADGARGRDPGTRLGQRASRIEPPLRLGAVVPDLVPLESSARSLMEKPNRHGPEEASPRARRVHQSVVESRCPGAHCTVGASLICRI